MTFRPFALAVLAATLVSAAGPASAHHAFNMYENDKYTPLTGVVKSYTWKNPHAMLELVVTGANGATESWTVELSAPNIIGRRGWSKTSLKVGDKVPLVIHPMKDGTKYGLMVQATVDGQVLKDKT
jgi:hypothetical protein